MGENFMTAITQIGELVRKRGQIIDKAAGYLADAIIDRMRSGKLSKATEKDITSAIDGFSPEEKIEILTKTLVYVGMNTSSSTGGRKTRTDDYDYDDNIPSPRRGGRGDIFRR